MRFSAKSRDTEEFSGRLLALGEFAALDGRAADVKALDRRSSHLDGARDEAAERTLRHRGFPASAKGEQPTRLGRLRAAFRPFWRSP
jgi:hypothetical protein